MRIRKLAFKNINCLKGEHEINFDEDPLKDSGIFAIIGPTGSGKSTILDVITLALFNRVPRFSKAISKGTIEDGGTVLTQHTNDAFASIEYMVDNKLYTSSWKIRKANTGNLQALHMDIYDHLAGAHLDIKPSKVPDKNEEIIKLDFDQFVKSIILSQGQFSKFLKSDKSERGKLLEKITGLKIYRKLGVAAFQRKKKAKENVDRMMDRIGEIQLLEETEIKEISDSIEIYKKQIAAQDKQIKEVEGQIKIHETIQSINNEIKSQEKTITEYEVQSLNFAPQIEKLKAYEKIAPMAGALAIYKKSIEEKEQKEIQTKKYELKIEENKKELESAIERMAELCKEEVSEANFMTVMKKFEKEVSKMDSDLKNLLSRGSEKRNEINKDISKEEFRLKSVLSANKNIAPTDAIEKIEAELGNLKKVLKKANIAENTGQSILEKEIETDNNNFQVLEKIEHYYSHLNQRLKQLAKDKENLTTLRNSNKEAESSFKKLENQLQEFKQHYVGIQKKKEDSIKLFELIDYRKDLKDGDPCPLCGSKSHPYADHMDNDPSGLDKELKRVNAAIDKLAEDASKAKSTIVQTATNLQTTEAAIVENKKHLKEDEEVLTKLKASFKAKLSTEEASIAESIQKLKSNLELKKEAKLALYEIKILTQLLEDYKILGGFLMEYKDLNKKRQSKFDGKDVVEISNKIQNQFSETKGELKEHMALHKKEYSEHQALVNSIDKSKEDLKKSYSRLGFASLSEVYNSFIGEEEFIKTKKAKEDLDKQNTKLHTELKGLKTNLEKTRKGLLDPKKSVEYLKESLAKNQTEKMKIVDLPGQQQEKLNENAKSKKKMEKYQKELDALNKEKEKWGLLDKFIGDANGNTFANFAQGLTLQNLLVLANHRLKELSERYLLIKPEKDGPLMVMDLYQGNITRAVNTLSGGESFIISLALALSLSDMASKNISIDSLFIDEGFGTLDSETLDIAMNTLEKLQTESQKTVGVISHIEAIKERINVQIQLKKNAQGYSQINVVN